MSESCHVTIDYHYHIYHAVITIQTFLRIIYILVVLQLFYDHKLIIYLCNLSFIYIIQSDRTVQVEAEMEDVRYAASFAAGPSNKDKIKELGDKHQNLRHVKEKSEGSQELVQRIEQGLAHIAELLGKC